MSIKRYEESAYGPGDFGLEGSGDGAWVKYDDHAAEVARLNEQVRVLRANCDEWERKAISNFEECSKMDEQVRELAALAEERREFIVNGVEFGYIRIPSVPLDKATGTYERCLLKPKFAADAILNEVRSQGVDMYAEHLTRKAIESGENKNHAYAYLAANFAARIRAGEVQR